MSSIRPPLAFADMKELKHRHQHLHLHRLQRLQWQHLHPVEQDHSPPKEMHPKKENAKIYG